MVTSDEARVEARTPRARATPLCPVPGPRRSHRGLVVGALVAATLLSAACGDTTTPTAEFTPSPARSDDGVWDWGTAIPGEAPDPSPSPASIQVIVPDTRPGVVLPSAFAAQLAQSGNLLPLGWPNFFGWPSIRYQQVFLGSELGTRRFFQELCLRLSSTTAGLRVVTLKLATASVDHTTMSPIFASNYGSDPVTVVSQSQLTIAADVGGGVDTYHPCFPFSRVYVHLGGNLLVELQVWPVGSGDFDNRPFIQSDACDGTVEAGCTTRRLWSINALSSSGSMDATPYGLVMKLIEAPAQQALQEFLDQIVELELSRGVEAALSGPLGAALNSLTNDRPATLQQIGAFINQVEGMRGSVLSNEEADALVAAAQALIDAIAAG